MANNEEITLHVSENSPYVIGARAYVEQTENGAVITIIDKEGTTTATVSNGKGIASATLNEDYTLTLIYTDGTSVTTTSIRGEKGESGVYCGSEEPDNPDVDVWIDPTGDPYPMEDEIADAVDEWITAHPEYVTTVQDGAITVPKFAAGVVDTGLNKVGYPADSNVTEGSLSSVPNFKYLLNKKISLSEEYTKQIDAIEEQITDSYSALTTSGLIERPNGINLFNKNSEAIETGKYYNQNGTDGTSESMGRILIEVPTVGAYSLLGATSFYGASNVVKIPIFKTTDKSYIGTKVGTLNSDNNIVTISGLDSIEGERPTCYIGYSFKLETLSTAFVSDKAETEVPNFIYKLNEQIEVSGVSNPLKGKTAVFMGDSICDATAVPSSDTDYYRWGWAGRIGNANDMTWHNYGSSGASITNMTGRGCIQNQLTLAISNYPDADYIILEGGTNDADVIESDPNYSIGTFDKTDYTSTYDGTTFCGALETFLRNTITAYPTKKIGFIIAQKMGLYTESLLRRRNLFDVAKQICEKWGVPCIDIWSDCIMNPKITAYYDPTKTNAENITSGKAYVDGQHLTDVGYDTITPSIELWMKEMR